jgi:hypothetical protein
MQSVPMTTDVVSSDLDKGHYVIKFVSDLRQVSGFLRVLIIIFSYHRVSKNLDFYLNGKSVLITTSHKHLGVTFINDVECPY